ncbi:hypothetical protein JMK10_06200 [Rhodovulum sulfidophilum]|uniref:GAD-like domain-containing protein n=1 Tax=Rhodovulum sulfidophilum TaxID=35806 RepID=UPI0019249943|nr:GAD-like domain-containing protein [Rhodovulum sulfidophilum]MBL3576306.1 hypothetical protein [Rhodovulum sulfidophilum]MCE8433188.1 hypothetical protein [Rhodovulum sulfidophilum]MCF4116408.1 hypothetical protein [Rhodovulum sulfidophilum]
MTGTGFDADIDAVLGPASDDLIPVPDAVIRRWTGRLPNALIRIWTTRGFASLAGGRLHLAGPARLAGLMSHIFANDPDLGGDSHAIAYGDLGELVLWSERHGYGFLMPTLAALEVPNLTGPEAMPPDQQFIEYVLRMPPELIEAFDPEQQMVHARLVERLGPLPAGMIYGATPVPPSAGGTPVENYVLAEVEDWLEAVYTEMRVSLVDWSRTSPQIRFIGDGLPGQSKGSGSR